MENKNNDGFSYTYSAQEQSEIRKIRDKYEAKEEDKMERLRRLDAKVTQKAQTIALVIGIIGVLILGLGMSLIMSDLSSLLGSHKDIAMPLGIIIGILGFISITLAYPIYNLIVKLERKKIAPEIIRLADELMK